jgi:hypothetical protein
MDEPPANGSSRSFGGFSRGHALGNVHNFGDPILEFSNAVEHIIPQGHVDLAIVYQPPRTLSVDETSPVIKVSAPCYGSMKPLLQHIKRSYSPIESRLY